MQITNAHYEKLVWENMQISSNLPILIYWLIIPFKWNNAAYAL